MPEHEQDFSSERAIRLAMAAGAWLAEVEAFLAAVAGGASSILIDGPVE